jgi:hypothetical protein
MVCDTLESSSVSLAAMATFQQLLRSKATTFDLITGDQLEVVSNLRSLLSAEYMHPALSCRKRLLPIAQEFGVQW